MDRIILVIARDFSDTPGSRRSSEGKFSGESFFEKLLLPKFEKAQREKKILFIDLDGTQGYATSFLEAAFGGLARRYDPELVLRTIEFKSDDEPYLIQEIQKYIKKSKTA